ncbi:MAG: glycosyltransferase family 4 protein [Clostridia bacterium]|nr:glycosyltransferase family 4 protein [Clostridia bacterium]
MKKICIVTTVSSSIDNWIKPFLPLYHAEGFDVSIVTNMTAEYKAAFETEYPYIHAYAVNMPRGTDLAGTLRSIPALYGIFKREQFDLVQYSTPNASFYSAIASRFAGVPVRLYCQWGMVFVSCGGIKRAVFRTIEKITCRLSTNVQPDSFGNLDFCRKESFYDEKKSEVIWNGSAKGVNLEKFDISKKELWRKEIRERYGVAPDETALCFVGRLGRDKGCNELFAAFQKLSAEFPGLRLLFVGPIEKENTIDEIGYFRSEERIVKTGRVPDVEKYLAAADIFVLPSYREGFGMSVVEAEAMGLPVIVTDIPGPTDAMRRDETGLVIPVKDADALVRAVRELIGDADRRVRMGQAGRALAENAFDSRVFARKLIENRRKLTEKK